MNFREENENVVFESWKKFREKAEDGLEIGLDWSYYCKREEGLIKFKLE